MEKKSKTCRFSFNVCFFSLLLLGVIFACGGSILFYKFPDILKSQIGQSLMLIEGTEAADRFESPPVPTYLKIFIFNVTNPEEVNEDAAKPILEEIGPYVYRQNKRKIIKEWNETLGTITYQEVPTFHFEPSMSLDEGMDKLIYHVNAPDVGAADYIQNIDIPFVDVTTLLPLLGINFGPLVVGHTARELLFDGYRADQLERLVENFGQLLNIPDDLMPDYTFAVFYGRNNTPTQDIVINSGVRGMSNFAEIVSFNNSGMLPYWVENSTCATINGTDGNQFAPHLDKTKPIYAFSPDVCRSLKLVYSELSRVMDIDTYRYVVPPEIFQATEDNMCFCMRDLKECNRSGVLPISTCQKGNPVVLSLPHFYMADQDFRDLFVGLNPDEEKHSSYVDVEPMTGLVLKGFKRLQANIEVTPHQNLRFLRHQKQMIFPILWLSEEGMVSDAKAAEIRDRLLFPVQFGHIGLRVLIYAGVTLVVGTTTLFALAKCLCKRGDFVKNRTDYITKDGYYVENQPLHEFSLTSQIVKTPLKNGFQLLANAKECALSMPLT